MLSPYMDEELPHYKADKIRLHLKTCRDCRREIESLQLTDNFLAGLTEIESSDGFDVSFWDRIENIRRNGRLWSLNTIFSFRWRYYYASALIVILIVFSIMFYNRNPVPTVDDEIISEHLELFRDYEIINHLDLLENWDSINMLKVKS
ncbi:MAG: zf-HC2 domain-containing protein [Spirochaetota bacterium]|nr:zf-HC2 domain-containing protein [Spirochaetota bacterium]